MSKRVFALEGPHPHLRAGDVFTIAGVYAVDRVTKERLPHLAEFKVDRVDQSDLTAPAQPQ